MLVWILITFHEVSYKRQKNAKNSHNMNMHENLTYQDSVCKWYEVVY